MNKHLLELESEAIFILREVVASFDTPVLLFSGGKDSIVLAHLAKKAFYPGKIPFPFLHIDTGYNFPETIDFRDELVKELGVKLLVGSVEAAIFEGWLQEPMDKFIGRNRLQSEVLKQMVVVHGIQAAIGGARRDEDKARAKERIFSIRSKDGGWQPEEQSPELWSIFNTNLSVGQHFRIFPLSDWTERDIWDYILEEKIKIPTLYFTHKREVIELSGQLFPYFVTLHGERQKETMELKVRCRTIGDMPTTGMWESNATTIPEIIRELDEADITERGLRLDDKTSQSSMEDRKKDGYF